MNKCIIAISGHMKGKTMFQEIVQKLKYKITAADCGEELQEIIERLGWDGWEKNSEYYKFYNDIFKMANDIFDFKYKYLGRSIAKFLDNENASDILILNGSDELVKEMEDDFGIFHLFIAKNQLEIEDSLPNYDKVILLDSSFEDSIKSTINILLDKENVNA